MVCAFDYGYSNSNRSSKGFLVIKRKHYTEYNNYMGDYIIDCGVNRYRDSTLQIGDSFKHNYFRKLFDKLLKIKR